MDFIPVDPRTVDNKGGTHRGRLSYPMLKSYMESNLPMAMVDMSGVNKSLMSLRTALTSYVQKHDLPVYIFQRQGNLYMARLDMEMQEDGTVIQIPDWREREATKKAARQEDSGEETRAPTPLSMEEVNQMYEDQK